MKILRIAFCFIFLVSCNKKGQAPLVEEKPVNSSLDSINVNIKLNNDSKIMYVNEEMGLIVRVSPNVKARRIDTLEFLTKVKIKAEDNYEVTTDGLNGIPGHWVYVISPIEGWAFNAYRAGRDETSLKKTSLVETIENVYFESSLWQIITDDSKYLILDNGTTPPPRSVIVKNLESGETIFSGYYYGNINFSGTSIEICKFYGKYYAGEWSINDSLNEEEMNYAQSFLENNEPPKELVEIADSAQGNGLGLLIIIGYNFETMGNNIIRGEYIGTM
jgi:hypothetical protein